MSRILIVDDEPSICWGLARLARALGLRVDEASSAEEGLALAAVARPDLLVLDVRLPGMDGLTAMESFRRHIGAAPIIVITAFGDLETAVGAVENGAFEYVLKPFNLAEIRAAIERALRKNAPALSGGAPRGATEDLLGDSPVMQAVFKRIALAAKSEAAILITGETGVGKEAAARAIHRHSDRRDAPFVAVNIAALAGPTIEAEIFGYAAGALPGVASARRGLLVQADGGTLFLDDVADIPEHVQGKLRHAIDQREALPIGGSKPVKTSFRIVSATRRDLREAVQAHDFRQDLYLRLATFEIDMPPLRKRGADICMLAAVFAARVGRDPSALSAEALRELESRPWHGNVRELRSAMEHALVTARSGAVLPEHLPEPLPPMTAAGDFVAREAAPLDQAVLALANTLLDDPQHAGDVYDRFFHEVEPPLLATALQRTGNRCAPAARVLGLHRTTLKRKLDQYGLDEPPRSS